jgi:hypothetical protein
MYIFLCMYYLYINNIGHFLDGHSDLKLCTSSTLQSLNTDGVIKYLTKITSSQITHNSVPFSNRYVISALGLRISTVLIMKNVDF